MPLPGERARLKLTPFPSPVVIAFCPDGRTLASGAEEIRLWDVHAGRETRTLARVAGGVSHLAFSGDGRTLTAVSQSFPPGLVGRSSDKAPGDVTKLVVCPWDFTELVVRQWDVATRREKAVATLRACRKDGRKVAPGLWFAAFTPDLMMMASPTVNHSIRLWDVASSLHDARPKAGR